MGLVWWPALDVLCRESEGLVDVVEVEPEAYWVPVPGGGRYRSFLKDALGHLPQPKLLHGVGAPLAGTCAPPLGHPSAMLEDIALLQPAWVSEHLNFSQFQPACAGSAVSTGFMLPPLQTLPGAKLAAHNIRRRRALLGNIPLAVETPVSYLPPVPQEWGDGAYIAEVASQADCGILLDLHNVFCNDRNGRQSCADFCDSLPLERVWEIHLAGGESKSGFHIDSHCGLVEPELRAIAERVVPNLPSLRAIILEIMPERVASIGLPAIADLLEWMKALWCQRGTKPKLRAMLDREHSVAPETHSPKSWELLLGGALTGIPASEVPDSETQTWWKGAQPGVDMYRKLMGEARASAVAAAAPVTTRLLLRRCGEAATRRILGDFWRQFPPFYTATDEARAFLQYLSREYHEPAGLTATVELDLSTLDELSQSTSAGSAHPPRKGTPR